MENRSALGVIKVIALAVLLTLVASGCSGGGGEADGASPSSSEDDAPFETRAVTLRMPWVIDVTTAPFFLAEARGYYDEAGFDVTIGAGRGSQTTVQTVARGSDEFGVATADAAIAFASSGGDVRIVAALQRAAPAALVYKDDLSIEEVADLTEPGVVVITSAGDSYHQQLMGLVREAGLSESDIDVTFVDYSAYPSLYRDTPKGVIVGGVDSEAIQFRQFDPNVRSTPFADLGLTLYGNALLTSNKLINDDPEMVERFVQATIRGWEEARADPQAAVDAVVEANPDLRGTADTPEAVEQLEAALSLTDGPTSTGEPVGLILDADVQSTLDFLHEYMDLKRELDPDVYYTNRFVVQDQGDAE